MVFGMFWFNEEGKLHLECAFLGFCACVGLWFIERGILHLECAFLGFHPCVGLWFIERGILHFECAFLGFWACVGLWFIERGIWHLECAFLGFCACVGLWFIERGNITVEVRLSCRADHTDRTNSYRIVPWCNNELVLVLQKDAFQNTYFSRLKCQL